jgi:hypothetical protein
MDRGALVGAQVVEADLNEILKHLPFGYLARDINSK